MWSLLHSGVDKQEAASANKLFSPAAEREDTRTQAIAIAAAIFA